MKIIENKKSKHGEFDLVAKDGYKLRTFIDFESKLLIVGESLIDISNIPSYHGYTVVPTETFIVDTKEQKILSPKEWKKYFKYDEPIETFSKDGKYKEIWIRVHEEERNRDAYEGYLIEIETGKKLVNKASYMAFRSDNRISLIDEHYQSIERRKKSLDLLKKGKYPKDKYQLYLHQLAENDLVLQYLDDDYTFAYELRRVKNKFQLNKGDRPARREDWDYLSMDVLIGEFETIDEFWKKFATKDRKWFLYYYPRQINRVIEKYVISLHNKIVEQEEISYDEHEKLSRWMNRCFNKEINRNVYWQFCSSCKERVLYFPRYPKNACRICKDDIIDEYGNPLNYESTHELYGDKIRLKSNQEEVKIFIGNDEYWASEARFGGIVYQKKEEE